MLQQRRVHATVAAQDIDRARQFYQDKLGLSPTKESPDGLTYECGEGSMFHLYPSASAGTAKNTVMSFAVPNIENEVKELQSKGVEFEEYDSPGLKTENGIAITDVGKVAWFKDSEGNIIGVAELKD